ncbi:MAG: thiolase C-terminal domain-containing protein [Candidatus Kariarchaeaceae archaeon]|jgi:acetyl-CoA C-acetyltransferase
MTNVAIVGVGVEGFRTAIRELSYKEMVYQAANKAYADADNFNPRTSDPFRTTFISCEEDLNMGVSITDEYAPDQLGAARRTVHTITGDGIQGMAAAYMQIKTGMFDVAVVEAQSRHSDIVNHNEIQHFALDPGHARQFYATAHAAAGLEKRAYMQATGTTDEMIAEVAARNMRNALHNPNAAFGARATREDILKGEMVASPLRESEIAQGVDGAIVVVMASEQWVKERSNLNPVWVKGMYYATETPNYDTRDWAGAKYASLSAHKVYQQSGLSPKDIDIFEVDSTYSYKELQHLDALGVYDKGEAGKALMNGSYGNINLSGGTIGVGNGHDVNGLQRVAEVVDQVRGHAGRRQVSGAKNGLAFSWRGVPTTAGAMTILGGEM